jgi:PAS domain S-box-containing protein
MPAEIPVTTPSSEVVTEVIEWLPLAALVIRGDGVIVAANHESERLFGYVDGELLGQSVEMLVADVLQPDRGEAARTLGDGRNLFGRRKDGSELPVEIALTPIRAGEASLALVSVINATEQHDMQAAVEDRIEFERLVGELGAEFINLRADDVDRVIEDALGRLVRALGLDRSALFQIEEGGDFVHTHQWTRPGWAPTRQRISAREQFPWHLSRIRAGDLVSFNTVDEIPDEVDRDTMRQLGTRSGVTVPLMVGGLACGALSFVALREPRRWTPTIINRLRVVALIFAHALARKTADERLRVAAVNMAGTLDRLRDENQYLRQELKTLLGTRTIVGHSAPMRRVLEQVRQAAMSDSVVLLVGETGTGKTLLASRIHELGPRSERALVRVNCGSLSPSWSGYPDIASGSTLLLDDVADLPLEAQASLARALDGRDSADTGNRGRAPADVRLMAATRRDLKRGIDDGTFREDLYYLLSVFTIHVPPLRERRDDIPLLVWRFVDEFSEALHHPIDAIDQESMAALQAHNWAGNARELRNVVERAMLAPAGHRRRLRIGLPAHAVATARGNGGAATGQAVPTSVRRGARRSVRPVAR